MIILLTIFLKHDQSKNIDVAMGLGQIVALRMPPEKLQTVNIAIDERIKANYQTT